MEGNVELAAFERFAKEVWDAIDARLKVGVVALVVDPDARWDPEVPDAPLLGECISDPALAYVVDAPIRSFLHLYYGSFVAVAEREPDFPWEQEIRITVRHELQHHLEWRAGHDALGHEDDLQMENLRRLDGREFDHTFYRFGAEVSSGVYTIEDEAFLEVAVSPSEWSRPHLEAAVVGWHGWYFETVPVREQYPGSLAYAEVVAEEHEEGADARAESWRYVTVVFRKRRWGGGRTAPKVLEWLPPMDE